MSYFDRLPPEDQGWARRWLFRVLGVYLCLLLLLLAGAGLRIGVVEPLTVGWADVPKMGEMDGRFVAPSSEVPVRSECGRPDCASASVDGSLAGPPAWAIGFTD